MKFSLLVPLWGRDFTRRYIEFFLPAMLPDLASFRGESYFIITTPDDEQTIRGSAAYRDLASMLAVRFLHIGEAKTTYGRMSAAYEVGLRAVDRESALVFLTPDNVLSHGSFERLKRLAPSYRAVMLASSTRVSESFIPDFLATGGMKGASGRQCVALMQKHLHPSMRLYMLGGDQHHGHPAALYWELDGGFVVRHFVHHPLLIRPKRPLLTVRETLDYDLGALVPRSQVYVCTDSDDMLLFDVDAKGPPPEHVRPGPLAEEHVLDWLQSEWPTSFHRWLGKHALFFHSNGITAAFRMKADEADQVLRRLYRQLPPWGFVCSPRQTTKRMLSAAPTMAKAPWYRPLLSHLRRGSR